MKQLIYFSNDNCGPCKMFKPIMQSIAQQYPVRFVDTMQEMNFTKSYNIRAIPTVVLVDNGNEVMRKTGAQSRESILSMIR